MAAACVAVLLWWTWTPTRRIVPSRFVSEESGENSAAILEESVDNSQKESGDGEMMQEEARPHANVKVGQSSPTVPADPVQAPTEAAVVNDAPFGKAEDMIPKDCKVLPIDPNVPTAEPLPPVPPLPPLETSDSCADIPVPGSLSDGDA